MSEYKYKIIRHFYRTDRAYTIKRGLTLEEAQAHCKDPETKSKTAKNPIAVRRTMEHGTWFDGYDLDT